MFLKKTTARLVSLSIVASMVLYACSLTDLESLTDDLTVNVNTEILKNPLVIQYTNPGANGAVADDSKITVSGPDAASVYTLAGYRNLKLTDGLLNIGIDKEREISPENPLEFTLTFEKDGFITQTSNYFLVSDSLEYVEEAVLELDNAPAYIQVENTDFAAPATGTTEMTEIELATDRAEAGKTKVMVPMGTTFKDEAGNALSGTVKVEAIQYDLLNEELGGTFPSNFVANDVKDMDGNDLGEVTFESAGFIDLKMTVGNKEVQSFNAPIELVFQLDKNLMNPETNKAIAVGDEIPVFSQEEVAGTWQQEGIAKVSMDSEGNLVAIVQAPHLSRWFISFFRKAARTLRQYTIFNVELPADYKAIAYALEVVSAKTNRIVARRNFIPRSANYSFSVRGLPANSEVFFRYSLLSKRKCADREVIQTSNIVIPEGFLETVDVKLAQMPAPSGQLVRISGSVSGFCNNAGSQLTIQPSFPIYARNEAHCDDAFRYIGSIIRGNIYITLEEGATYDFRVPIAGQSYTYTGVSMTDSYSAVSDLGNVNLSRSNGGLSFNIDAVPIPKDICDAILGN